MNRQRFIYALKVFVRENQLSYEDLAKQLEIPLSTFYKWTSGHSQPSKARLQRICNLLDLNIDWILGNNITENDMHKFNMSIDSLNLKYFACMKYDTIKAKDYVVYAGATVFNTLLRCNVECEMVTNSVGEVRIHNFNNIYRDKVFLIFGGPIGICISMESEHKYSGFDKLTDKYLNSFTKIIANKEL